MENNYVSFDGSKLSFFIDNIKIINGNFPSSLEIEGEYQINSDSLTNLVAAIGDGVVLNKTEICSLSYSGITSRYEKIRYMIYSHDEIDRVIIDENKKLAKENDRLVDENNKLENENNRLTEENENLKDQIERHNKSNWLCRMRKINKEE